MSSENRPVRLAWTRHARALTLRRWLIVALMVAVPAASATLYWRWRHPAPPPVAAAPATETAAPPAETAAAPPSDEVLRVAPSGQEALILGMPTLALAPSPAPAQIELPPSATPADQAANEPLPTVAVKPPPFHVIPDDSATHAMGPVTVTDRNGKTLRVVPPAGSTAPLVSSTNPPPRAPRLNAPVVANPPVFSGRARAAGALALDVQGQTVRLFGVRAPEGTDRCGAGTAPSCAALAEAALRQRLAGHPIVACRVPPGQPGAPGAICLDEEGNDLGRYLVIQGLALSDAAQSYDYIPAEGAARTARRGLWRYR